MLHSIHDRIKKRRKELKMSQADLAAKVGIKAPAISQYESGARNPSYEVLRKLSAALNVTAEYLKEGTNIVEEEQPILQNQDSVFLKIANTLTESDKKKLLEYATFLASGRKIEIENFFVSPTQYANHILEERQDRSLPVDIYSISKQLGMKVFEDDLKEGEGILIQGEHPVIILDNKINLPTRKKFTLASLIGHYLIPWHLNENYVSRKYGDEESLEDKKKREADELLTGKSTLLTEEVAEMEAHEFAFRVLIPTKEIQRDFVDQKATINKIMELSSEKYGVSLFLLVNRLVDFAPKKYAVVQSKNNEVIKVFQGKRQLISGEVNRESLAASFVQKPPTKEEIREGSVSAKNWVLDPKENEKVYEQSIFNPKIGKVLTLLTFEE